MKFIEMRTLPETFVCSCTGQRAVRPEGRV
jgi:hypothetical protein